MEMDENDQLRKNESYFAGRKPAVIGCLLVILTVIAFVVVIFVFGTMEATPDDINNPGP